LYISLLLEPTPQPRYLVRRWEHRPSGRIDTISSISGYLVRQFAHLPRYVLVTATK